MKHYPKDPKMILRPLTIILFQRALGGRVKMDDDEDVSYFFKKEMVSIKMEQTWCFLCISMNLSIPFSQMESFFCLILPKVLFLYCFFFSWKLSAIQFILMLLFLTNEIDIKTPNSLIL